MLAPVVALFLALFLAFAVKRAGAQPPEAIWKEEATTAQDRLKYCVVNRFIARRRRAGYASPNILESEKRRRRGRRRRRRGRRRRRRGGAGGASRRRRRRHRLGSASRSTPLAAADGAPQIINGPQRALEVVAPARVAFQVRRRRRRAGEDRGELLLDVARRRAAVQTSDRARDLRGHVAQRVDVLARRGVVDEGVGIRRRHAGDDPVLAHGGTVC